jgi:hypothetical protein
LIYVVGAYFWCNGHLSTRVRFYVRIAVRLRVRFAYKGFRVSIILRTPITTACEPISGNISLKLNCKPPCAGNRTQNRTVICTQNRTCRRPFGGLTYFSLGSRTSGCDELASHVQKGHRRRTRTSATVEDRKPTQGFLFHGLHTCELNICIDFVRVIIPVSGAGGGNTVNCQSTIQY